MKKDLKIAIVGGWYESTNIGDQAILICLKKLITEFRKERFILYLFGQNNTALSKFSPDKIINTRKIFRVIAALKEIDVFLLGGGTPFFDSYRITLVWIFYVFFLKLFRKKIIITAVSVQPYKKLLLRNIYSIIVRQADIVTFRDNDSLEYTKRLVPGKDLRKCPDPALFANQLVNRINLPSRVQTILIVPRLLSDKHDELFHPEMSKIVRNRYVRELVSFIQKAKTEYEIALFPFHEEEPDSDLKIIYEIRKYVDIPYYKNQTFKTTIEIFNSYDFILGTRLHSIILAASLGKPAFAISYASKVSGFVKYCNVQNIQFEPIESFSANSILKFLKNINYSILRGDHYRLLKREAKLIRFLLEYL